MITTVLLYCWQLCPVTAAIGIPLIVTIFPEIYGWLIYGIDLQSAGSLKKCLFRYLLRFTYTVHALMVCTSGLLIGTLALITLHCINVYQLLLLKRLKLHGPKMHYLLRENLAVSYKQLRLLVGLCDQCFQQYSWPNIQFCGSAIIICSLFPALVFWKNLPVNLVFLLASTCILSIVFVLAVHDYGSRPLVGSQKFLFTCSKWWRRDVWARTYFQGCQPIFFKIGHFHRVDRSRGPSLMRFCLQRTFFLVVKFRS